MQSIRAVCEKVDGAFAVVLLGENGQMIIARKGSPMVVAYSSSGSGIFVASDSLAVSEYCDKIIYVPDCSVCDLTNGLDKFVNFHDWSPVAYRIEDVSLEDSGADKEGFDHFMLKEIYDQPSCVDMCLRGRICDDQIKLGGFLGYENIFATANHITIVACGSSYHAGILAKYFIEELCGIKTSVEHASEFKYRINNNQVVSLLLLSLWIEQNLSTKKVSNSYRLEIIKELGLISSKIQNYLNSDHDNIQNIAKYIADKDNCLYLGRGICYPIALEGALKLKEISYIRAEGYPAGEMKHGPIALIDKDSVQMLSYYTAIYRGCNVDKPRNLAKSVTVE